MTALLAEFHFLRPAWLLALLLLPLLWQAWRRRQDRSDPWRAACDPHLLAHLRQDGAATRGRLPLALLLAGYVLAVLALAGPAFRALPQPLARAQTALVVALDLSSRMRAADLKPDRVSRARFKIADLLAARREGQTALVAYAGDAFTVAPLTDDAHSLADLLAALAPDTMPTDGQRTERAIALAQRLVRDAGFARGELLLVTDRADAAARAAAARARREGLTVSVLGVGTPDGAPVPLPQGGFLQDEAGNVQAVRLDEASLRALAEAGGGRYARLGADRRDLAALALGDLPLDDAALREDERTRTAYRDEGPWVLLLLLPLAALAFRRGWLGALALVALLPAPRAEAFEWDALWRREDQRVWHALQAGEHERALAAEDPAVRGAAAYRREDYAQAAQAFAGAQDADAHYNRGNALARAQRYREAIAAYDRALQLEPAMEDAQANRKAVEDFLRQQQDGQSQDGSAPQDENQPGNEGQAGEPEAQDPQDPGEQSSSRQAQGQSQQEAQSAGAQDGSAQDQAADEAAREQAGERFGEEMQQAIEQAGEQEGEQAVAGDPREAEKQQAVEQWLRRVPDDPGGLLRRKFALEHQRRRRQGGDE